MLDSQIRVTFHDQLERSVRLGRANPALLDAATDIIWTPNVPEDEPTVQVADRVLLAIYDLDSRVLTREEYLRELRGALDDLRAIREPAASPGSKGLAAIPRRSRRGRVAARPPRSCGTIDAR